MIQLNQASFSYNTNKPNEFELSNINLEIKENETYGILGLSGCGKSTLLKCIAGIYNITSGAIKINTDKVSMVFQQNALFDSMTVYENIFFPIYEFNQNNSTWDMNDSKKQIEHYLKLVGLHEHQNKNSSELSGGMRKRLGIIRSLILNPNVLLYDEPTAGLDPITAHKITELIKELNDKNNITSVVVSSDYYNTVKMSDRIGMIIPKDKKYTLFDLGKTNDLKNSTNEFLQQFISGRSIGPLTI